MNYIGSKSSLISFLLESMEVVIGKRSWDHCEFTDLFAGTGAVGREMKQRGCLVTANDLQFYSYITNLHFIQNNKALNEEKFEYLKNLVGIDGFLFQNYCMGSGSSRNYFSDDNGRMCDAIRMEIMSSFREEKVDVHEHAHLLGSLIWSMDKCANTAAVYGSFLKRIKHSALKPLKLEYLPVVQGLEGMVHQRNATDLIYDISGDILYLDPPYNARQYSANYHVLETIACYDNPQLRGKTGLRDYSQQKSDFCSKRKVEEAMDCLLRNARFQYVFLSYSNEGLLTAETIERLMKQYGQYQFFTKTYPRFKANKSMGTRQTVEYLHCLTKF